MRVEKIELAGFKSFGDRTVFKLHPGITCIVGPNGCGKSNIVDAFKWVLGEQSVKSLRGGKMEEVIYAGSSTKKPRGMSEVSLYVSGLGPSDNGKESTTVVSRRLYRSGDSEYLLNRENCRLRDIRDIFLDTGLEVKSYSMLEQDKVSVLLHAKPEERRFLIEEVAGVVKYKVRRHEAKNKLENSRNNLTRINDIIAEVARQLRSLDRLARKAERYKKFMEELRDIELRMTRLDYEEMSASLGEVEKDLTIAREHDSGIRAEISSVEAEIESRRIALTEEEKRLDSLQEELQQRQKEVSSKEQAIAVLRSDMEHLKENIARLGMQAEENQARRAEALARREELAEQTRTIEEETASLSGRKEAHDASLKAHEESIREEERGLEGLRRESLRMSDETSSLKNELNRLSASHEGLGRKHSEVGQESLDLDGRLSELEDSRLGIQQSMLSKNNELLVIREERTALERASAGLKERLESLRTEIAKAREELASSVSRLESLKEMDVAESSLEAFGGRVEVLAPVSEAIDVPKEYERAMESALREAVDGFVLGGYSEIRKAVEVVADKELGRTAFIPSVAASPARGSLPEGALGFASDLVRARGAEGEAVRRLLEQVVIVRDLEAALKLTGSGLTLITLAGEVVEPSGTVVAGKGRGVLSLRRQAREIEGEMEMKRRRVQGLQGSMDQAEGELATKEEALKGIAERMVEQEKALSLLRLEAEKNSEEAERAGRKQAHLKIELDNIEREREGLAGLMEDKGNAIKRLEDEKSGAESSIVSMQEKLSGMREEFEARRTESVDMGMELTLKRERLNSMRNEDRTVGSLIEEMGSKDELLRREAVTTRERVEAIEQEMASKEEQLKALVLRASETTARISEVRDVIEGRAEELRTSEQGLRGLRVKIDDSTHRISELDIKRTELRMKRENLVENIRNAYDVELPTLAISEVSEEERERLPELKAKLDSIGPVSLGSIEEYDELKERHEFLSAQHEDLQKSIAELEEAISRINATTRKKLREAYSALREKFSEVFVKLFGGGRAELVLTDESNILETGIDIIAQPPGKRFQNITLLSGGEKTLTALALLFSGFLIKPTPLCILDEADAALDESNTLKFADLLKSLAEDIQFIVVTHNRVTMESADYMYGITMEEPGNSKVISLELAEA
jgi:chromosome segregation protein